MLTLVLKSCHLFFDGVKLSISLSFETKVLTLLTLLFSKNCNKITKFFKFIALKSIFSSLVYTSSKIFILPFCQIFSNLSPLVYFLVSFVLKSKSLYVLSPQFCHSNFMNMGTDTGTRHGHAPGHKVQA